MVIGRRLRPAAVLWQAAILLVLAGCALWLGSNAVGNLELRRINSGFGFLDRPAGIPIGEALIDYRPGDSNLRAITVGLVNTVLVSVLGVILASILGLIVGVSRLSNNWLLSRLGAWYVEFVRNVPLLAHLMLIYGILQGLPPLRSALSLGDFVFISNRGLVVPSLQVSGDSGWLLPLCAVAIGGLVHLKRRLSAQVASRWNVPMRAAAIVGGLAVLSALWHGAGIVVTRPRLDGLNFTGGLTLSPELTALLCGLVVYFGAFIAEIVRGGILAVSRGQWQAGYALGLRRAQILRWIILPQALRIIIPPTTNQYLDLAKGSSLAVAIGYPDLVSVINSVITDSGQAIECVAMIMGAFLIVNLSISFLMNLYNAQVALVER